MASDEKPAVGPFRVEDCVVEILFPEGLLLFLPLPVHQVFFVLLLQKSDVDTLHFYCLQGFLPLLFLEDMFFDGFDLSVGLGPTLVFSAGEFLLVGDPKEVFFGVGADSDFVFVDVVEGEGEGLSLGELLLGAEAFLLL